ncbi:MAG: hypothetical protein ACRDFB_01235, partial [Rhabdochlamydiaceae bacterium]
MAKRGRPRKNPLPGTQAGSGASPVNTNQPKKPHKKGGKKGLHNWVSNPTGKRYKTNLFEDEDILTALKESQG